ncbi:hypothetical protein EYB25_004090 [Talaromyces marneffei]|uniref:uncharacterized protein n=1 Tax=Talaromyces marneffei TaxID=37727 RepID=UPI0012A7FD1A|nr:uncharacterized protein EYB26_004823 [Talaromyces marneffei]KAE8552711.1 hypothetical protein EYB25_004090 [Talaromyces marneffei]QGA17153.1 hypothetical protein EYB26_004823 [Talaromyces marneffei]
MKPISRTNILKAALAFSLPILSAAVDYCTFDNSNCIDGLAQVSVSFKFDAISPVPLLFYYGFDAGWGSPSNNDSCAVKVGYWLQYDRGLLTEFNSNIRGINWTTEVALRIGNLGGYVGGANNGCNGVWGHSCSENLKTFLRSSLFNLSTSGQPYDFPLDTVLQPLTTGSPGPFIDGCPATLFALNQIPTYVVVNATTADSNNSREAINVAEPGNPSSPWRTWYIPGVTAMGQAQEVAVGIIARTPNHGSKPLNSPNDIQLELVCARAPRQGPRRPPNDGDRDIDNKPTQGYARGIIKTYAFDEDDFLYDVEADNDGDEAGADVEDEEYYADDDSVTGTYVDVLKAVQQFSR